MYPNDPFRPPNYDRIPRFPSQIDRPPDRRPREFPGRSQSTQIDRFTPRDPPMMRKGPNIPPMIKSELSQRQQQLVLLSLPTDFEIDPDDPLNEIISVQSEISENFLKTLDDECKATMHGIDTINKAPHCSKVYKDAEEISSDLTGRYRYVETIQDGSAANLEKLLTL